MTEEQKYTVERKFPMFEVRRYEPCVFADVIVNGDFESAGSLGFRPLIGYISGNNQPNSKIAMTAPVIQEPVSKIAMTSPVLQQNSGQKNIISFVMPAGMTLEALPIPSSSKVSLREVPEQLIAVSRFSGRWNMSTYMKHVADLESNIAESGFIPNGSPRFARFDPPWTPWFMRRNEIQIPIATPTQ
ncbi:unannotated protein [freshwater metagenome]|uniref:Unannotated protein n=1 Tax=freshwater metagenome TaxID=449393 RepID=A0A6J5ZTY3_9ZZZZ|nr:heme-binding protein [Actinomycetota bacterium]MSW25515.1 heme-binding protein [Actinomycetota bacterium]MSX43677.1 heme-binding protein [Actinomycetota bacterium]MSX97493.1 heme-binding protein [Actinomycetota bacterium]MSY53062.1 heme-binding protein [Actinomycetota bacterium]